MELSIVRRKQRKSLAEVARLCSRNPTPPRTLCKNATIDVSAAAFGQYCVLDIGHNPTVYPRADDILLGKCCLQQAGYSLRQIVCIF